MIEIFYEVDLPALLKTSKVETFIQTVMAFLCIQERSFSISFVNQEQIQTLNHNFRDKDYPTDVLTFCLESHDDLFPSLPDEKESSLGDIIICTDIVNQNAQEFQVSLDEELRRVIIHGILHLLGKNHATNDANEPMLIEQEYIMEELKGLTLTDR